MFDHTATNIVHFKVRIFNDAFEYFKWYLTNDTSNVDFQFLNRNRLSYVDSRVYVAPKVKV